MLVEEHISPRAHIAQGCLPSQILFVTVQSYGLTSLAPHLHFHEWRCVFFFHRPFIAGCSTNLLYHTAFQTQSYPSAHLTLCILHHLSLHLFYLCVSLHQVPFFSSPFPTFLWFYLLLWKCSLKTVVYRSAAAWVSLCGQSLIHCTHPLLKVNLFFFSLFFFGEMTQGGRCFWQSSRGSDSIPCTDIRVSSGLLYPPPSLTYISCVVHVFHKTLFIKGVSYSAHSRRIKVSFLPTFLFLVVVN